MDFFGRPCAPADGQMVAQAKTIAQPPGRYPPPEAMASVLAKFGDDLKRRRCRDS